MLLIISISISCDEIIGTAVENIIENNIDDPNLDTYLEVENNSLYTLERLEFTFGYNEHAVLQELYPSDTTGAIGFYQITTKPYVRFFINNIEYKQDLNSNSQLLSEGNFIMKINVISTQERLFTYQIIPDSN